MWRATVLAAVVLAGLVLAGPASSSRIYWGAWIGPQFTGGSPPFDWSAEKAFVRRVSHKQPSIVHFYSSFAHDCTSSGCSFYPFNTAAFSRIRRHGMIPMVSWNSASAPISKEESRFQDADVAAGRYDGYIRRWAKAAKRWGHPFFLRFDREMNGTWFPWSAGVNGNTSADFVAAWRHVHRIFSRVGARNATWVWCPNVDPYDKFTPMGRVYPGDRYVDWTCLDGYNFGTPWRSFAAAFRHSYRALTQRLAPHKPLLVGEVATIGSGSARARWIGKMLRGSLRTDFPRIKGFAWFDAVSGGYEWPLETSRASRRAFRNGISSSHYATASRRLRLGTGKVHPLG